jgi:hypothetical protein
MTEEIKVAYILGRFPTLSETFISNEIIQLVKVGADLSIYSLHHPGDEFINQAVIDNKLLDRTYYFRWRKLVSLSWKEKLLFIYYYFALRWGKHSGQINRFVIPALAYFAAHIKTRNYQVIHTVFIR